MTKEAPDRVSPSGEIPNNPNPSDGKGIPFALEYNVEWATADTDWQNNVDFNPVYYPDRFTDTMEKEVERDGKQCGGEDISIDKTKNPEFHAKGIVLDGNVSDFRLIRKERGPVNLITPLTDNEGGMEVIVTKGEIGEIVGWDSLYQQWQFSYTLDMVATGNSSEEDSENQVVSEVLEQYQETTG